LGENKKPRRHPQVPRHASLSTSSEGTPMLNSVRLMIDIFDLAFHVLRTNIKPHLKNLIIATINLTLLIFGILLIATDLFSADSYSVVPIIFILQVSALRLVTLITANIILQERKLIIWLNDDDDALLTAMSTNVIVIIVIGIIAFTIDTKYLLTLFWLILVMLPIHALYLIFRVGIYGNLRSVLAAFPRALRADHAGQLARQQLFALWHELSLKIGFVIARYSILFYIYISIYLFILHPLFGSPLGPSQFAMAKMVFIIIFQAAFVIAVLYDSIVITLYQYRLASQTQGIDLQVRIEAMQTAYLDPEPIQQSDDAEPVEQ
jgi:hypothetical protein